MAKDPAFLFYPGDWLGGTMGMSRLEKGGYIDLLMLQFNMGHMPEGSIKNLLGTDYEIVWPRISRKFCADQDGNYFNERLEAEATKRAKFTESRKESRAKGDEDNVRIYLVRDTGTMNVKIGSSVNPQRRFLELCNQKNPAILVGEQKDYILLWHSDPTERKVEKEIHAHFSECHVSGEWFDLSHEQIEELKDTFFPDMSSRTLKRMTPRTENENEISISTEKVSKDNTNTKLAIRNELIKQYSKIEKTSKSISNFINSKNPDFSAPYMDLWNLFAPQKNCSLIEDVTGNRGKRLHTRLSEKRFDFVKILTEAYKQDFEIDGKVFLNFDWIIKNADNYVKVLEGNYRKKAQENNGKPGEVFTAPKNAVD